MNQRRAPRVLLFSALAAIACGGPEVPRISDSAALANLGGFVTDVPLQQGEGRLRVDGGRIWYRVVGADTGIPIVLLHGGPGGGSYYLKPLEALGDERPVVRYDQLGGGRSDGVLDVTKMDIAHFVAELEALRSHLGYTQMHLYGHAWGSILAVEYYRAHPQHVASLVLASASLDMPQWAQNETRLMHTLSPASLQAIAAHDADATRSDGAFAEAMREYNDRYVTLHPDSVNVDSLLLGSNRKLTTYLFGNGGATTGSLSNYNATAFLPSIVVPTLYTVGDADPANPNLVREFASATPGARVVVIRGAGLITTWDNPGAVISAVREHLARASGK